MSVSGLGSGSGSGSGLFFLPSFLAFRSSSLLVLWSMDLSMMGWIMDCAGEAFPTLFINGPSALSGFAKA